MENEAIKLASTQGIWAVLTIILIFYILKAQETRDTRQEQREKNYQDMIDQLTQKFDILKNIETNIIDIKDKLK